MTTKHIKLWVKLVYKARGTLYTLLYVPVTTFRKKSQCIKYHGVIRLNYFGSINRHR